MDRHKRSPKMATSEDEQPHRSQDESVTPGAAEGDLDTVEQDLQQKEEGGPIE
jgi:hypothetical protein